MRKLFVFLLLAALLATPAYAASDSGRTAVDPARCSHHFEVTVLQEATCADKGLLAYTCSKCGLTYTAETLPSGEHDYALTGTTATCILDGDATYTCTRCGDTYTEHVIATGHVPEDRPASCTHSRVCANCGEVLTPATGHDYVYQYDAEQDNGGSFLTFGTWQCVNCGRTLEATEGNAIYYYDLRAQEEAAAAEAAAVFEEDSGTDIEGTVPAWEDEGSETDTASDASGTDTSAGETPADPKTDLWLIISGVAVLAIIVETVMLVRSLKKAKAAR